MVRIAVSLLFAAVCVSGCRQEDLVPVEPAEREAKSADCEFSSALILTDRKGEVRTTFLSGEPVYLQAQVTNIGSEPVTRTGHRGRHVFFMVRHNDEVRREDGDFAWWDVELYEPSESVTYAPGETRYYYATWDQRYHASFDWDREGTPVPPGEYRVYLVDNVPVGTPEDTPPDEACSGVDRIQDITIE